MPPMLFLLLLLLSSPLLLPLPPTAATSLTSFNYTFFQDGSPDILLLGDAFVDAAGAIRLNNDHEMYSLGRASYSQAIRLWDKTTTSVANFTTSFSFEVNVGADSDRLDGGMAFFLSADPSIPPGSDRGYLGLTNSSSPASSGNFRRFLAVEFDSFMDTWDPSPFHVGVDLNSIVSVARADLKNGSAFGPGAEGEVEVSYDGTTKTLRVVLDHNDTRYELSHVVDVRDSLPEMVYVGFSATTDASEDVKVISSWAFESTFNGPALTGPIHPDKSKGKIGAAVTAVVAISSLMFLGAALFFVWLLSRREKRTGLPEVRRSMRQPPAAATDAPIVKDGGPRSMTFQRLAAATECFKKERWLGSGAFGCVYRGFLEDLNIEVAVKRITADAKQGRKGFDTEVRIISQLSHRNLVKLVGWCKEADELLLVYEYMPNGSLDSHLFNPGEVLPWPLRYRIAHGVASAGFYLHEGCDQFIVHRDIKCSNILLDHQFNAKLGDFGLAKLAEHGATFTSTMMAGTLAYMAPECFAAAKASKQTDVYSFGIVALELACGRRAMEPGEEKGRSVLVRWLRELCEVGDVMDAADQKLGDDFDRREMERLIRVGLWCAHPEARSRPSFRQVITALDFEIAIPDLFLPGTDRETSTQSALCDLKSDRSCSVPPPEDVYSSASASSASVSLADIPIRFQLR